MTTPDESEGSPDSGEAGPSASESERVPTIHEIMEQMGSDASEFEDSKEGEAPKPAPPAAGLSDTEAVLAEALQAYEGDSSKDSDAGGDPEPAEDPKPAKKPKVRPWLPVVGVLLAGAAFYAGPKLFKPPPPPEDLDDIRLVISSIPPSEVYRGEELLGPTPQTVVRQEQGEIIRLVKDGYVTQSVGFHSARPEKVGRVIMTLSFLGIPLDWEGMPEEAEVIWDGKPQPLNLLKEASPGEHLVKVGFPEGPPVLFKFALDPPQGAQRPEPFKAGQRVLDELGRRRTLALQLTLPGFSVPEPEVPEPVASPTPGATPAVTPSPAISPAPEVSPAPKATPTPKVSPQPKKTPKPGATPGAGATPSASATPAPPPEPEVPDLTVALLVEEITEEHEPFSQSLSVGTRTRASILLPREGRYRLTFAGSDEYGQRSEEIEVKENGMVVLFGLQEGEVPVESPTPAVGATPAVSPTPSVSATPGASPTPAVSATPGVSPTPAVSATPGISPTPAVSPTPSVSATPSANPTPSVSATPSAPPPGGTPAPKTTPRPAPKAVPTPTVSSTPGG